MEAVLVKTALQKVHKFNVDKLIHCSFVAVSKDLGRCRVVIIVLSLLLLFITDFPL